MSRLLALWLTLLAAFWLTRAASSALLFGTAGGGPGEVFQLVTVPALQALLVAWATRRPGPFRHAGPLRLALRQSDLRGLLLLDAAVLLAGWIFLNDPWAGPWLGLAQERNLQSAWVAIKTGTAGALLARSARGDRWVLALAAELLVLAGLVLAGLVGPAPDGLLRWLVFHGLLLAIAAMLVLEVQRAFRKSRPAAALALDWALGLALLAGLLAVLGIAGLAGIAAMLGSLAATALLAASRLDETSPPPERSDIE